MCTNSNYLRDQRRISLSVLALLATSLAHGQFIWLNPVGGSTGLGVNWVGGVGPTTSAGTQDVHINSLIFPTAGASLQMPVTVNNFFNCNRLFVRGNVAITTGASLDIGGVGSRIEGPLSMQGGILRGNGDLTTTELLTVSAGTLLGTGGLLAQSGIRVNPTSATSIEKPLTVHGTSTWESGIVYNDSSQPFLNNGSFSVSNGTEWWNTPWTNAGTIIKNGTANSRFIGGSFTNSGAASVQQGILTIESSASAGHSGSFDIANLATLVMNGTVNYNSGSTVLGSGTLKTNGGLLNFLSGSSINTSRLEANYGTIQISSGTAISGMPPVVLTGGAFSNSRAGAVFGQLTGSSSSLTFGDATVISGPLTTSGSISGAGSLTVQGPFSFSGGTVYPGGDLIASGGLNLATSASKDLQRNVIMGGTSTWSEGQVTSSQTVTNTGSWSISAVADWFGGNGIINSGQIVRNAAGTANFATVPLTNNGTMTIDSGTLKFGASSAVGHAGQFAIGPAGTLILNGSVSMKPGSSVGGEGQFKTYSGTVTFQSGSSLSAKQLSANWGTLNILSGASVSNYPNVSLNGGALWCAQPNAAFGSLVATSSSVSALAPMAFGGAVTLDGSIQGPGTVWIGGLFTFTGGQLSSGGKITASAGIQLSGAANKDIQRDVDASGTSTWSSGTVSSGGAFTNSGTWNISANSDWSWGQRVTNTGTVTANPTGVTRFISVPFNNSGSVNVNSGSLKLEGGSSVAHTGTFTIAPSAALSLGGTTTFGSMGRVQGEGTLASASGNITFNSGSSLASGTVSLDSASLTMATGSNIASTPTIQLNSGTVQFSTGSNSTVQTISGTGRLVANSPVSILGPLNIQGMIEGSGTLNIGGLFTYPGGQIAPGGAITAAGGMLLNTAAAKDFKRDLNFQGNTAWEAGQVYGTGGNYSNSGTFTIGGDLTWQGGGWTNSGTIVKAVGAGVASFEGITGFNNNGTVSSTSGTLAWHASGTHAGTFSSGTGATLHLIGNQNFVAGGRITGAGTNRLESGTLTFGPGSQLSGSVDLSQATMTMQSGSLVSLSPTITLNSSSATFSSGGAINLGSVNILTSSLTTSDDLSISNSSTMSGGYLNGPGSINFNGGLQLTTGGVKTISSGFNLNGTSNWTGGIVNLSNGKIVQSYGTFVANGGSEWSGGVFNNRGTFRKLGTSTTRMSFAGPLGPNNAAQFSNSGTVDVQSGLLQIGAWGSHTGTFSIAQNATLAFDSGQNFRSGSVISGGGIARFDSGNTEFASGSSFSARLGMTGGTVNFRGGSSPLLQPDLNLTSGGILNLSSGALIQLNTLTLGATSISGSDQIKVNNGFEMRSGTLSGSGSLVIPAISSAHLTTPSTKTISRPLVNQGTINFDQGVTQMPGGQLNNSGSLYLTGDVVLQNGSLINTGQIETGTGGAQATLSPDTLTNSGAIKAAEGQIRLSHLTNLNTNTRVLSGGTFRVEGTGQIKFGDIQSGLSRNEANLVFIGSESRMLDGSDQSILRNMTTNAGAITLDGGAKITVPADFVNTGQLNIADGSLELGGTLTLTGGTVEIEGALNAQSMQVNGGTLRGSGMVTSSVTNLSEVNPGNGIGSLNISGDFTQAASGRMRSEINGTLQSDADLLYVQGDAVLGGELIVDAPSSVFIPSGTRFRVLTATGSLSGSFSIVPPTSVWAVQYFSDHVDVVKQGTGNVYNVSGRVVLNQFNYLNGMRTVHMDLLQNGSVIQTASVTPSIDGAWMYSFQTAQQGTFQLRARAGGFVSSSQPITITNAGVSNVNFTLSNGDADGSNEVDAADIDFVINRFGSVSTGQNYDASADCDNSLEVDAADIDIVISNFGTVGN